MPRLAPAYVIALSLIATLLPGSRALAQDAAAGAVPAPTAATATSAFAVAIDCIEVELFKVADTDEKKAGQTDRAETIPAKNLEIIQAGIVRHLPKEARGVTAITSGATGCPNPQTTAVLAGDILDFRKGNMALRYFVGFGAGAQKVRVRLTLNRKDGGAQMAQSEIADTKWSGAFGGTNTKGLDDFAEKAAEAAAKALRGR